MRMPRVYLVIGLGLCLFHFNIFAKAVSPSNKCPEALSALSSSPASDRITKIHSSHPTEFYLSTALKQKPASPEEVNLSFQRMKALEDQLFKILTTKLVNPDYLDYLIERYQLALKNPELHYKTLISIDDRKNYKASFDLQKQNLEHGLELLQKLKNALDQNSSAEVLRLQNALSTHLQAMPFRRSVMWRLFHIEFNLLSSENREDEKSRFTDLEQKNIRELRQQLEEERSKFAEKNLRLPVSLALETWRGLEPRSRTQEVLADLIQAGNRGLIQAIDSFEPAYKYQFSTNAYRAIRNEINGELARALSKDLLNAQESGKIVREYLLIQNAHYRSTGQKLSDEEIAKQMGMKPQKLRTHLLSYRRPSTIDNSGREGSRFHTASFDEQTSSEELQEVVQRALSIVSPHTNRSVLLAQFGIRLRDTESSEDEELELEPRTLAEIGREAGFSREIARQRGAQAKESFIHALYIQLQWDLSKEDLDLMTYRYGLYGETPIGVTVIAKKMNLPESYVETRLKDLAANAREEVSSLMRARN